MNQAYTQILFFVVIVGVFWLLFMRPQQQQAKKHAALVASVKPGDEIMTIGGIFATVVDVSEKRLRVRLADGAEMEIARSAVSTVGKPGSEDGADEGTGTSDSAGDASHHEEADD